MSDDRWRKVSEEMPPTDTQCLLYGPELRFTCGYLNRYGEFWSESDWIDPTKGVTHWRPLPAPPEED